MCVAPQEPGVALLLAGRGLLMGLRAHIGDPMDWLSTKGSQALSPHGSSHTYVWPPPCKPAIAPVWLWFSGITSLGLRFRLDIGNVGLL